MYKSSSIESISNGAYRIQTAAVGFRMSVLRVNFLRFRFHFACIYLFNGSQIYENDSIVLFTVEHNPIFTRNVNGLM